MISDPVENDRAHRAERWVLAAGACIGLASFLYYYGQGLTTAHYDAKAHLVVARRIVDSVSPGYHQMGAHWLPLIHLLYLPLVLIETQYRSGFLPSLVSICAFTVGGWAAFRIGWRSTGSVAAGIFAASILLANGNLEYLQSCPLTEPVALMLLLLSVDSFMRWREAGFGSLPWMTACWASLGALCRYEGWYVFGGILVIVAYDAWCGRIARGKAVRACAVLVAVLAVPLLAHFGYVYARLGDTFLLRVARGNPAPYLTYRQPVLSLLYHLAELVQITAVIPLLTAAAGVAYVLWRGDWRDRLLPLFLLWLPSLTNVSALYWGLIYRVRYSVLLVPALAVFSALLITEAARRRALVAACLAAVGLPWVSWYFPHEWRFHEIFPGPGNLLVPAVAIVLFLIAYARKESRWPLLALCVLAMQIPILAGEARPILEETTEHAFIEPEWRQVVNCLRSDYDGSRVLLDIEKLAPLAYDSGLPLKSFIYNEGDRSAWLRALGTPRSEVGWLCALKGDEVWEWLAVDPEKADGYSLAVRTDNFRLYRLKGKAQNP